uniref:Uncharacterized protein n=1 Tax=Anopheles quadriannulatus TaxID=34691 RepID=A0A182XQ81_ANOQN
MSTAWFLPVQLNPICIQLEQQRDRGLCECFSAHGRAGCSGKVSSGSINGCHNASCIRTFSYT